MWPLVFGISTTSTCSCLFWVQTVVAQVKHSGSRIFEKGFLFCFKKLRPKEVITFAILFSPYQPCFSFFLSNKTTVIEYHDVTVLLESLNLTAQLEYLNEYLKYQRGFRLKLLKPTTDGAFWIQQWRWVKWRWRSHTCQNINRLISTLIFFLFWQTVVTILSDIDR